jgi:phage/plasmid-like protein (TIGR03299 family)
MAHMIETMAYAGQTPWHGLGVVVEDGISPDELLEKAGLAWDAELVQTKITWKGVDMPLDRWASVRSTDGAILTPAVSKSWKPVQNKQALEFFNDFCMAGDMKMETAGAIRSGKWIWALAKIKESFSLFKGKDVVDGYLLFSNPHTAGRAIMIQFTPIRVVCNNTLMMSLESYSEESGAGRFKHLHTDHFDPEQAKAALGIAKGQLSAFRETAEFLAKKRMKNEQFLEFAQRLFPANDQEIEANREWKAVAGRRAQQLVRVLDKQPGAELGEGTWWQGVNAVTYLLDHKMTQNQDKRLTSAWLGFGRDKKIEAVQLATKMAA